MEIKRGIPVSPGVAIGPALVLDTEGLRIPRRFLGDGPVDGEVVRLRQALAIAAREAREKQQAVNDKLGKQYGAIFGAHALLIEDPALVREVEGLIREHAFTAEYAVSRVIRRHVKALQALDRGGPLAGRGADLFDIEKAVLRNLLGERRELLNHLKEPVVV